MARTPRARRISRASRTAYSTSTDKLSLTAGVRYSTDKKDEMFDNSIVMTTLNTDENHFDWKAGVDYKFTENMMLYASASTSYRPQAFNPRPFQVTQFVKVDGEEATSYEIGFKSDLADNRAARQPGGVLRRLQPAHPAGGWHRVPGRQQPASTSTTSMPPAHRHADSLGQLVLIQWPAASGATTSRTFYQNIPATIQGAELEVQLVPVDGLTISGQYGYTDFQGDEFDNPSAAGQSDRHGDHQRQSDLRAEGQLEHVDRVQVRRRRQRPWQLHAATRLLRPEPDLLGHSHQSDADHTIDTTEAQACSQAYELLNARVEWASPEDTWRVALGATNLTDEEYYLNKFDLTAFGQPTLEGQPGAPREWYVQFTRNFN